MQRQPPLKVIMMATLENQFPIKAKQMQLRWLLIMQVQKVKHNKQNGMLKMQQQPDKRQQLNQSRLLREQVAKLQGN